MAVPTASGQPARGQTIQFNQGLRNHTKTGHYMYCTCENLDLLDTCVKKPQVSALGHCVLDWG